MFIQVGDDDNWIANQQVLWFKIFTSRLVVAARSNIVSMILLKVFELVVNINWSIDIIFKFDVDGTPIIFRHCTLIGHIQFVFTLQIVARDMFKHSIALADHVTTDAEAD